MDDLISRQAAIDALMNVEPIAVIDEQKNIFPAERTEDAIKAISDLPSARPEIIKCKDCKWRDENWRRVAVRWLPCMDVRTGGNWFCGSAERKTDE